ncbi:unnamed protein product [Spodoptera littoralis]|uniref:Uncharacterized protein n=1 Tax=Spodoptera littoralis TaxID=7109 RepID=A0A9P0IA99_SPOLI|nr:unnamed protein product [Spodoptera littoralis]
MNVCVVSVQVILVVIFLVQCQYGFAQVEADSQGSQGVANLVNSLERKINIQELMNGLKGKDKKTENKFVEFPTRKIEHATGTLPNTNDINEEVDFTELVNSQELAELYTATSFETRASEVTSDEANGEPDTEMVTNVKQKPKRKRKIKKRKKNRRRKHSPVIQELKTVTSSEVEKAEFGKNKIMGKYHNKPHRNIRKRKFIKTAIKDANINSDSDEAKTKPVDIIVHIKMND